MNYNQLHGTSLKIPPIIFGTSSLGNLYRQLSFETKRKIIEQIFQHVQSPIVLDTAGKYGAGMALEVLGDCLRELKIPRENVVISNKLGWFQIPLKNSEPTFEPGVWKNLQHDAEQRINYRGILDCWEQGCELIGEKYSPDLLSVHDPDEYIASSQDESERQKRLDDVLGAYQALFELKQKGKAKAIGIGAKDWTIIREISQHVDLDWVMLACSFTIKNHSMDIVDFMKQLNKRNVSVINSAVFNSGFLTGGEFYDYRMVDKKDPKDQHLFRWREQFYDVCHTFDVQPAAACVQFGLAGPYIISIAMNTAKPERVAQNVNLVQTPLSPDFWRALEKAHLVNGEVLKEMELIT